MAFDPENPTVESIYRRILEEHTSLDGGRCLHGWRKQPYDCLTEEAVEYLDKLGQIKWHPDKWGEYGVFRFIDDPE